MAAATSFLCRKSPRRRMINLSDFGEQTFFCEGTVLVLLSVRLWPAR